MANGKGNEASPLAYDSPEAKKASPLELSVVVAQVVVRVSLVIGLWLVLCFSVFLGFFTIPLLMLLAFALIYAMFDLHRVFRRTMAARRKRASSHDNGHPGS